MLIATKETIEQLFDGAAAQYNRVGPDIFSTWGARLVERLGIAGGERVLDVATGTGAVLIPAAQLVGRYGQVVGIDLAGGMLQEAENAGRAEALENFELYKMDAERLEFRDGIFDIVACAFSIFFFPVMDTALREMQRVLRTGGRLGITVFGGSPPPFDPGWGIFAEQARAYQVAVRTPQKIVYTPDQLHELLTQIGFGDVKTEIEKYDVVFATDEDWWNFQFTLGNRAALLRMSDEMRAKFKEEYLAKLRPLVREDGLHMGVSVVYAVASRQ